MGVAKSDFSQMHRSRSDLIKNTERIAQIDLENTTTVFLFRLQRIYQRILNAKTNAYHGRNPKQYEVSAGTVPYPLLKTLQVRYRIPSATGMGYGNFR